MSSPDIPISLVWLKKTARKSLVYDKSIFGRLHRKNSSKVQSQARQAAATSHCLASPSFSGRVPCPRAGLHSRPQGRIKAKLIAAALQCAVHHLQTRTISEHFSPRNFQHKTCFTKARCISSFQFKRASFEKGECSVMWVKSHSIR